MNDVEKYNVIECIVKANLFEITRNMELIKKVMKIK